MRRVAAAVTATSKPLSVQAARRTIFNASKYDKAPHDPSKQHTDAIEQAKSEEGANPAKQQAEIVKQQAEIVKQQNGSHQGEGRGPGQTQGNLSNAKTVNIGSKDSEGHKKKEDSAPG